MGLSFYAKISKLSPEHNKKPFRKQILRFQFSIENDDSANTTANHIIPVLKPNTRFSIHHQIFKCIKNNRVKNSITLRVAFPFAALEMGLILLLCKSKEKEKSRKRKYIELKNATWESQYPPLHIPLPPTLQQTTSLLEKKIKKRKTLKISLS